MELYIFRSMRQKNNLIYCCIFLFLFSCEKKNENLIVTEVINDSIIARGLYNGNQKVGIWEYIDTNGQIFEIVEFKIIDNKSYYNQSVSFNKKGDTIHNKTSFFTFNFLNDSLITIKFISLFDKYYDDQNGTVLLYSDQINDEFSNLNKVKFDTVYLKNNFLKMNLKLNKLRGIIKEFHFDSDSSYISREVFIDIDENSKNFPILK